MRDSNYYSVKKVLDMSIASAKHVSPLDNSLWHSLSKSIWNKDPNILTHMFVVLSQVLYFLSTQHILNSYRKCGYEYVIDDCHDLCWWLFLLQHEHRCIVYMKIIYNSLCFIFCFLCSKPDLLLQDNIS